MRRVSRRVEGHSDEDSIPQRVIIQYCMIVLKQSKLRLIFDATERLKVDGETVLNRDSQFQSGIGRMAGDTCSEREIFIPKQKAQSHKSNSWSAPIYPTSAVSISSQQTFIPMGAPQQAFLSQQMPQNNRFYDDAAAKERTSIHTTRTFIGVVCLLSTVVLLRSVRSEERCSLSFGLFWFVWTPRSVGKGVNGDPLTWNGLIWLVEKLVAERRAKERVQRPDNWHLHRKLSMKAEGRRRNTQHYQLHLKSSFPCEGVRNATATGDTWPIPVICSNLLYFAFYQKLCHGYSMDIQWIFIHSVNNNNGGTSIIKYIWVQKARGVRGRSFIACSAVAQFEWNIYL